jgi:hypothetical protein
VCVCVCVCVCASSRSVSLNPAILKPCCHRCWRDETRVGHPRTGGHAFWNPVLASAEDQCARRARIWLRTGKSSACETGLGRIGSGDDVVGLTRGFLYAGTRTIVASLWQVEDQATGELMIAFYRSLAKGLAKRDALRAAQIEQLRKQPHPFYWAAFQLTGSR